MGMLRDKPTEEAIGYRAVVFLRAARNAQAGWNENGMYGLEHVEHGTRPRATRATSGGPEQMTKSAPKLEPAAYARAQRALRQVIREHPELCAEGLIQPRHSAEWRRWWQIDRTTERRSLRAKSKNLRWPAIGSRDSPDAEPSTAACRATGSSTWSKVKAGAI